MNISGHFSSENGNDLSCEEIELRLKEKVGAMGRVTVGPTSNKSPLAVIYDVEKNNELNVSSCCEGVAKEVGAKFHSTIDGETVYIRR